VRALEAQEGADHLEIVVVDDASTDDTWAVLARLKSEVRVALLPVFLERNSGPAEARNAGWRVAKGSLVAFTDDDCTPQPTWLSALTRRLGEADVVQGRTVADPKQADGRGPFSRTQWIHDEAGFYETCNIGYRREVLERLGGFDERFRTVGGAPTYGEDVDLAWRAKEAGARLTFEPAALVYHDVSSSSYFSYLKDRVRRAGMVPVVRRHPELRDRLYGRWFYGRSHPPALLAGAGLGLVAREPWSVRRLAIAAALLAPYVKFRLMEDPLPCRRRNRVPVMALALLADLGEVAVLIVSSIRYRTVLL
jgi:GT2 family glycosyltransferase